MTTALRQLTKEELMKLVVDTFPELKAIDGAVMYGKPHYQCIWIPMAKMASGANVIMRRGDQQEPYKMSVAKELYTLCADSGWEPVARDTGCQLFPLSIPLEKSMTW